MKTSEIEAALAANPQTVFILKRGMRVRLTKVHKESCKVNYGKTTRTKVTFEYDYVASRFGRIWNDGTEQSPECTIHRASYVLRPDEIGFIDTLPEGVTTLEEYATWRQARDLEEWERHKRSKATEASIVADVVRQTGMDKWYVERTPMEVLTVLHGLLNKEVTA